MNPIVAFVKLIRLPNLLIIALTHYAMRLGIMYPIMYNFSGGQSITGAGLKMGELDFFLLSLSIVMIAAAGYIINDYFDVKIDRVNRKENIIVGKHIKRRVAMGAHLVINAIAMLIGAYLAFSIGIWQLILVQLFQIIALWYYTTHLKNKVLIGNLIVALLVALVPAVVGFYELILQYSNLEDTVNILLFSLAENTPFEAVEYALDSTLKTIGYWVLGFSVFAFLITLLREIIKDIEDVEGDKQFKVRTLPVVFGEKVATVVAQLVGLATFGLISYYLYDQLNAYVGEEIQQEAKSQTRSLITVMYVLFTVQLPLAYVLFKIYRAKLKEDYHNISTYLKIIMLTGITYAAVFYFLIIKL